MFMQPVGSLTLVYGGRLRSSTWLGGAYLNDQMNHTLGAIYYIVLYFAKKGACVYLYIYIYIFVYI